MFRSRRTNRGECAISSPLEGIRVIELAGIGPGPFAATMLSDMGAEVVRVERTQAVEANEGQSCAAEILNRGRQSIGVNLKNPDGVEVVLRMVEQADVLIEGFRPGVTDRLGVGPTQCLDRNPRLIYGQITGWGQHGPYAMAAGHDINFVGLSGTLAAIGRFGQPPTPPINLIGDYGGGGMLLAFGVLCAIVERHTSGLGQVVNTAMVNGAALLGSVIYSQLAAGQWEEERGTNILDSGAPFYDCYECSDGRYVALGAIEPQFYGEFTRLSGLAEQLDLPDQYDKDAWPSLKERIADLFKTRPRSVVSLARR